MLPDPLPLTRPYRKAVMLTFLEEKQALLYGLIILLAMIIGHAFNDKISLLTPLITGALATLMFSMFAQIPFLALTQAFQHQRFFIILGISNYLIVPLIIALLLQIFPLETTLKIGVLFVLLTPCIDYVVVFTKLGKGDAGLMLSATPFLFITQMLLLPFYLWLFLDTAAASLIEFTPFVITFIQMIVIPFVLAMLLQYFAKKCRRFATLHALSAWLPVPFMAIVLFLIVSTQIPLILENASRIISVIPLYIGFMILTFIAAYLLGRSAHFPPAITRTLIFSTGTRNSLAVLPFAFALPADIAGIVAAVIVTQTLVELLGELVYTKITPHIQ